MKRGHFLGRYTLHALRVGLTPRARLLLALACLVPPGCTSEQVNGDEQESPAEAVPVHGAEAVRRTLRPSLSLLGTVEAIPERVAEITARLEGQIQIVGAVEGEFVQEGQKLVQMDARVAEAELQCAQGVVAQHRANLDRLEHGFRPEEIEIAQQAAHKAEAAREESRLHLEASSKLHADGEMSDVEFSRLQSALRAAEADCASAAATLTLTQKGPRPEDIQEAQAVLKSAEGSLALAQLNASFCTITSPIAGTIVRLDARQGMSVSPAERLAVVVDASELFVRIRLSNTYLLQVTPGSEVELYLPMRDGEKIDGRIERLSGEANSETGDVDALAIAENKQGWLKPGMTCRVRLWLPAIEGAVVVPHSAIADRDGASVVSVVREGKAYETEVTVGIEADGYTQITSGLSAGQTVITVGGYGLPDGCPVTVLPESDADSEAAVGAGTAKAGSIEN